MRLPPPFDALRIPTVIAALIVITAVVSIAAAIGLRHATPGLLTAGFLLVPAVAEGQLWRLVTWVFYEGSVLGLVFAALTLYWIGGDLTRLWGPRRFLGVYLGLAAAAGAVTCLVGLLLWADVAKSPYTGSWPVLDGLVVGWGILHADRSIRLYGLFQLTGRQLVWITFGLTFLYALFDGPASFVPHFAAELLVFFWLARGRGFLPRPNRAPDKDWKFDDWLSRNRRR